jgi:two-component system, chemotaxis family, sensor histidine kinase and response regulator PixL
MSQDKELEIQLQFLDEAQEYLDALETALFEITQHGTDSERINAALRAAHSIKGGAGMMGFQTLSQFAHLLEDSLKVLKVQRSTEIDAELGQLLVGAVDKLHHLVEADRQQVAPDSQWIQTQVVPIFDALQERLGQPDDEDAFSILSPDESQNIIPMLFESEIGSSLERLEIALENRDPGLYAEVETMAQEFSGLGEMLQLTAFSQLCDSVLHQLAADPEGVEETAALALQSWRQSQTLVLAGRIAELPHSILPDASLPDASLPDQLTSSAVLSADLADVSAVDNIPFLPEDPQFAEFDAELFDAAIADSVTRNFADAEDLTDFEIDLASLQPFSENAAHDAQLSDAEILSEILEAELITPQPIANQPPVNQPSVNQPPVNQPIASQPTASYSTARYSVQAPLPADRATETQAEAPAKEGLEGSVRVPYRDLDRLNDFFGELAIERSAIDLHLKRLRKMTSTLTQRSQVLEETHSQARDAYDRVVMQAELWQSQSKQSQPIGATWQGSAENTVFAPAETSALVPISTRIPDKNGFDSLEMDRYDDLHLLSQEVMETIVQVQEVASDIDVSLDDLEQTARELNKTARKLQTKLTQVRMRPLSDILDRFPRALRELALQFSKPVQLKLSGEQTLVDRNILEALSDPLMHLLRNAFDHGIEDAPTRASRNKPEQGVIEIRASQQHNRTVIQIRDDGGGIPLDKIRRRAFEIGLDEALLNSASDEELVSLIFEPGFSTSNGVTSLSGRGVGMDVVRDRLKQIQGEIKVETQKGMGTTFTLSVPFTLSVMQVLLAQSRGMLMAFPVDAVEEIILMQPEQVARSRWGETIAHQGEAIPLIRLAQWLSFHRPLQSDELETPATISFPTVLILKQNGQRTGMQIDRCWGEQEVAIRKVEGQMPMPAGFPICTILGDGRVVPLVSVPDLLYWITSCERSGATAENGFSLPGVKQPLAALPATSEHRPTVLVVDDSINVRRLLALTLEKAGYQVAQAKDGQDALDKLSGGLQVQAVVCDIEMPRLDGYGVLAKIRANPDLTDLPIAMLTSRSGRKHRQLAMSLGATEYLSKPYNEQVLLQALKKMVSR